MNRRVGRSEREDKIELTSIVRESCVRLMTNCLGFSRRTRQPSTRESSSGSRGQGGNAMHVNGHVANVVPVLLLAEAIGPAMMPTKLRYQSR